MPTAQCGDSCDFVRMWVATSFLDVAALALHSWPHALQRMHMHNSARRVVIACAGCSHRKVTPRQANLIVKSTTPTITVGIRCWMHRAQRQHPYCCSSGGASLVMAGCSPSSTNRCSSNKRENSTQQRQSFGHCSISRYYIWKTVGLWSMLLFMVL